MANAVRIVPHERSILCNAVEDYEDYACNPDELCAPRCSGDERYVYAGRVAYHARIEVKNLPEDSALAASGFADFDLETADGVKVAPVIRNEANDWYVLGDATLVYLPPDFHFLRPLLAPFAYTYNLRRWVTFLLGILSGLVLPPFLAPIIRRRTQPRGSGTDAESEGAAL